MWVYCFFKHYVCWRPFWIQWKQYYPGTLRFEVVCPYDDSMKSLECDNGDALFSVGPIKMRGKNPEKLLPKLNYHSCGRGWEFYMQREESSKMRGSQGFFLGGGGSKRYIFFFCQRGYASLFSQELPLGVLYKFLYLEVPTPASHDLCMLINRIIGQQIYKRCLLG